jgi:haloalkane dehalogenase
MPAIAHLGRCIAPDLIRISDSDKLPDANAGTQAFDLHSRFLNAFMGALSLQADVLLMIHDWGSALGFNWATHHRGAVRGIAYMEWIVLPLEGWNEF